MARKTKGRQKIEMVKMEKIENLRVTFSKRCFGLFKKASDLSTLCGVDVAAVVSSPGGKVFSFGSPSVNNVVDRFVGNNPPSNNHHLPAHRNSVVSELNSQLNQVENNLHVEKIRAKELEKIKKARQSKSWWENPIDQMDLVQLRQLEDSLLCVKDIVRKEAEKVMRQNDSFQNLYGVSSSYANGGKGIPFVDMNGASSSRGSGGGAAIENRDGASSAYLLTDGGNPIQDVHIGNNNYISLGGVVHSQSAQDAFSNYPLGGAGTSIQNADDASSIYPFGDGGFSTHDVNGASSNYLLGCEGLPPIQNLDVCNSSFLPGDVGIPSLNVDDASFSTIAGSGGIPTQNINGASSNNLSQDGGVLPIDNWNAIFSPNMMSTYGSYNPGHGLGSQN